ncbi:reverse transcriptase domain-containing protein [Tanacetum coccineum]
MVKTGFVEAINSLVPLGEHLATFRVHRNGYSRKGQKTKLKRDNVNENEKEQEEQSESSEGAVGLIRWFERTESVFFPRSILYQRTDGEVATSTLIEELYPGGIILPTYGIRRSLQDYMGEFKKLLIRRSGETLLSHYGARFEKMMDVFIGGLPLSIEGITLDLWQSSVILANKVGHLTKNCRNKGPAIGSNLLPVTVTCHACRENGHYAKSCRKSPQQCPGRAIMLEG